MLSIPLLSTLFITLDGLAFTDVWSSFTSTFGSVLTFIGNNSILLAIIAVPLGVGFVAIVMKVFR